MTDARMYSHASHLPLLSCAQRAAEQRKSSSKIQNTICKYDPPIFYNVNL